MVFGKNNDKGIRLDGLTPQVVDISNGHYSVNDLWVNDELDKNSFRAHILSQFDEMEGFPTPIGVYTEIQKTTYDEDFHEQIEAIKKQKGNGDLKKLLYGMNTWEIK